MSRPKNPSHRSFADRSLRLFLALCVSVVIAMWTHTINEMPDYQEHENLAAW